MLPDEFNYYYVMFCQDITLARETGDETLIRELRSLWDGESWARIQSKLDTPGSTWVVWFDDGLHKYIGRNIANKE